MKYKTVIEVICDAHDEEDAYFTAGEYLCGNIETGVEMSCRTKTLKENKLLRFSFFAAVMAIIFSVFQF